MIVSARMMANEGEQVQALNRHHMPPSFFSRFQNLMSFLFIRSRACLRDRFINPGDATSRIEFRIR